MTHGDAREGKWRGNWWMQWVASTLHTTSKHDVSSITTADAHTSAASSRLNWCLRRFKWTRPCRRKTKSVFCACAITFQLASKAREATDDNIKQRMRLTWWIPKATNTHSGYVILIAFPCERASMLRYTYNACIVSFVYHHETENCSRSGMLLLLHCFNALAPELFFKFQHTLYIKCE